MTTYNVTVIDKTGDSFLFEGEEGAKVNYQVLNGMDVHAMGNAQGTTDTFEIIIPFHAIGEAQIATTVTEDPTVTDAVCNETNSDGSGDDSEGD